MHDNLTLYLSPEAVRLVQGPSRCSGMLEVKFGQSWAPVCESSFSSETALVTCRDLECGFPDTYMGRRSRPYEDTRPVFKCDGKEKHLMDCPTTTLNITEEELSRCYNTHLTCTGNTQGSFSLTILVVTGINIYYLT